MDLDNPVYLRLSDVILAVEPPHGWVLDSTRKNPFFFLKSGEKYDSARTLMYINIERLNDPLRVAVEKDAISFRQSCKQSRIEDGSELGILEDGCEHKTQLFICEPGQSQKAYVDLNTKISIHGLLLNVVLSSDSQDEIQRYKMDFQFLLKHLAVVAP